MNREELKPGFKKAILTSIKGKRSVKVTSLIKTEITPENEYTVSIPALNPSQCIIRTRSRCPLSSRTATPSRGS